MGVVDDGRRTSERLLNIQLMIDVGRDFNLNLDAKLRPLRWPGKKITYLSAG